MWVRLLALMVAEMLTNEDGGNFPMLSATGINDVYLDGADAT